MSIAVAGRAGTSKRNASLVGVAASASHSARLHATPSSNGMADVYQCRLPIPHSNTNASINSTASKQAQRRQTHWDEVEVKYCRKIKGLILFGALLMIAGIVSACFFFKDRNELIDAKKLDPKTNLNLTDPQTATGPLFIATGLLVTVCGITWIPIYKQRIKNEKRKDQLEGR